jgi:hypothetical protein
VSKRFMEPSGPSRMEPWIRMRQELEADPVVRSLAKWLVENGPRKGGLSASLARATVVGMLHRTWCQFNSRAQDGVLVSWTPADLDEVAGVEGWTQCLASHGWILVEAVGLRLYDPKGYTGSLREYRALQAARRRIQRANKAGLATSDVAHDIAVPVQRNVARDLRGAVPNDVAVRVAGDVACDIPATSEVESPQLEERLSSSLSPSPMGEIEVRDADSGVPTWWAPIVSELLGRLLAGPPRGGGIDPRRQYKVVDRLALALQLLESHYGDSEAASRVLRKLVEERLVSHDASDGKQMGSLYAWLTQDGGSDLVPTIRYRLLGKVR